MSRTTDILRLGVIDLAAAIARGEVTSETAVTAAIERARKLEPELNAFIGLDEMDALERARAADKARTAGKPLGPLHGVPLAHKDMFWQAGKVMTGGSAILLDFKPGETATTIERLEKAGSISIGRLNMSEFAASPTGTNSHFGFCHNAWDPKRVPGGSSSGSGAVVAARIVPAALGSDTGGSIRIPAALNGIVGIKPTMGRLSMHGTMPRAFSLDVVGPMARHAADCALLLALTAGPDPRDAQTANVPAPVAALPALDPRTLSIRVATPESLGNVAASVTRGVAAAAKSLAGLGVRTGPVAVTGLPELHALGDVISKCEAATLHRRWMTERPEAYSRLVYDRTLAGLLLPAVRYIEALSMRAGLMAEFLTTVLGDADALMLPVVTIETPTIEEIARGEASGEILPLIAGFTRLCRPFNYLGLPSVSVPCGVDGNGMPLAFQLVGRPMAEARLLAIADLYEKRIGFGLPAEPPISATA